MLWKNSVTKHEKRKPIVTRILEKREKELAFY